MKYYIIKQLRAAGVFPDLLCSDKYQIYYNTLYSELPYYFEIFSFFGDCISHISTAVISMSITDGTGDVLLCSFRNAAADTVSSASIIGIRPRHIHQLAAADTVLITISGLIESSPLVREAICMITHIPPNETSPLIQGSSL